MDLQVKVFITQLCLIFPFIMAVMIWDIASGYTALTMKQARKLIFYPLLALLIHVPWIIVRLWMY